MPFKDILAIVLSADHDEPAYALAEALSRQGDAHVAATFLSALPDEPLAYEPTVVAGVWAELLTRSRAQSEAERKKVEARLGAFPRTVEFQAAEALGRDLGRVAAVHARYHDVAIVTRPSEGGGVDLRLDMIEGVLFHAGRPVLIAPPGWRDGPVGRNIVVAWDASREATRSLAEAASFIDGCANCTVLTVDAKPRAFGHGDLPGTNIGAHLSRRGVNVTVKNVDSVGRPIAQALREEVDAVGADLLVMGGYAHSRLREFVFGGATRELLETANVPVLMAH